MSEESIHQTIDEMAATWESNIVARRAIKEFSGGALSPKTMSHMDSAGTGPDGRFMLNNKVVYPVQSLVQWLKQRSAKSWQTRKNSGQIQ